MAGIARMIRDEMAGRAFIWGQSDCCLSVCNVLRSITGRDPAAAFRGEYRTQAGAHRFVLRHGGMEGLAASVCDAMRWPEIDVMAARAGDVGASDDLRALAIYDGAAWVAKSQRGLICDVPVARAWRVS